MEAVALLQLDCKPLGDPHLAADGHRSLEDAVHTQDGRLWRVDDGRPEHGAEHAAVADGEGASVHVLHGQVILARLQWGAGSVGVYRDRQLVHFLKSYRCEDRD